MTLEEEIVFFIQAKVKATEAGKDAVFTHSIGKKKESETVLTEREFCSQLTRLRNKLFKNE